MEKSQQEKAIQKLQETIEDYEQTVITLLTFAAFITHDGKKFRSNSSFGFGRNMETSNSNAISPQTKITPDLVAQKSNQYGVVVEAKASLCKDKDQWFDHIEQLEKYDDPNLKGWWTENELILSLNALILIHISRSADFTDYVQQAEKNKEVSWGPNSCIIEFTRSDQQQTNVFFRSRLGNLHDSELNASLKSGKMIPIEKALASFSRIKYCDYPPPLVLILEQLWMTFFPPFLSEAEWDNQKKAKTFKVRVSDITTEMQKAFGSGACPIDKRSVEFPKIAWVRAAFEKLVKYRLATSINGNEFQIYFRNIRGNIRSYFIKRELSESEEPSTRKKAKQSKQLKLFEV